MSILAGRAVVAGMAALIGAGAGAATTVVLTSGAHEAITVNVGDTITPKFTVKTDTILQVVGTKIVVRKCGQSNIFLRTWRGGVQISADTIDVSACTAPAPAPAPKAATIEICLFPNPDSMLKYHPDPGLSVDPAKIPCDSATGTIKIDSSAVPKPPATRSGN